MSDRSYTFEIRSPPTSYLVKRAAGIQKGPSDSSIETPSAHITPEMVYNIALIKQADDNRWHLPLEGIARSVVGTARSMGIIVKEEDSGESEKQEAH
jgi:large subunit ribosomal protein L11